LVPRIAAEYRPLDWLVLRAGYAFERSPLLATNLPIYDTDKHTFAVGARFTFLRPLGLLPGRLNLDLAASDLWYVGRGILGRTAAGHVPSFSVGVEVSLL
jgi:long-subunit fatty acid transport protein